MYTKLVTEGLVNYTYQQCPEADTTSDLVQFTLAELGGPMIFLVVTSVLSMLHSHRPLGAAPHGGAKEFHRRGRRRRRDT